ncbi:branched-chain amino acid ABC transporter permease [Rhodomicrobium lacus]|uniref:branched-chain amino acid ABC transporter permease n=1 Tax=Rhodomicrobium TaxID=1068 RepID=UPI0026E12D60|nr:branched-chain amino acid ABC transporter permease [Rhodomicrobium lacus]WKW51274.1 branched-chain amino acid ABC transporter permease [Rhodomicrobium lacus]
MSLVLVQILNGLQYGLLLFLAASGLTLVFGILGVINLAHGSFYMLGAYLAVTLTAQFGDIFVALAVGIPLAFLFGAAIEWLFIRHLYKRDHLQQVLLTFALILVFREVQQTLWGNHPLSIPTPSYLSSSISLTPDLGYPVYRFALMAICVALALAMMFVIQRTRVGRLIRAAESNPEMVEALGYDSRILYRMVFAAGVALAAAAGILAAPIESAYPGIGDRVLIISFVIVVVGGIGSIRGAFLGSLLIGLADAFGKVFVPEFSSVLIYAVMALILVVRPSGLFGRA